MWIWLGVISWMMSPALYQVKQQHISMFRKCEYHSDCELPEICCNGLFYDYCCHEDAGRWKRLPIPVPVPNVTFPPDFPAPVPRRIPV